MNRIQLTINFMIFSIFANSFVFAEIMIKSQSEETVKSKSVVIVTVSGQEVMMNSEAGKAVQDRLKSAQEKLAAPLQKEGEKLQQKDQEIAAKEKSGKADKSELEFEKRELGLQIQKLQSEGQKVEAKLSEMYQKEMGKFEASVKETIKELAEQNNWDVVIMEEQAVYVNKKTVSKTSSVIKKLDEKIKAANLAKKQALEKELKATEKDLESEIMPKSKKFKSEN